MNKSNQTGQTIILALIVLTVIIIGVLMMIGGSFTSKQNSRYTLDSLDAANLAEAGIDKAVATLNKTAGSYNGETETALGNGTFTVQVTSIDTNTVKVTSTGYVPNAQSPKSKKTVSLQIQRGEGTSFAYGIQAGDGGLVMDGGSRVNGSVYSNSDVLLKGGSTITGDVFVAGGTAPNADQQYDCTNPNCNDYIFGKTVSGNSILDVAQSFQPNTSSAQPINKVALKIKKFGTPPNITVRILANNNGKPDKTTILTSGTLNSGQITSEYGFVEVGFISNPLLTPNSTYWIVLDTTSNSSNYYSWQIDNLGGYTRGSAAWSPNWQAGNPQWNNVTGDLSFKTYMGGQINSLDGEGSSYINGTAHANTMTANNSSALQIGQDAYYQSESNIRVHGSGCSNNSHCHPNSTDPQPIPMSVSDANITEWKNLASTNIHNGNVTISWPCPTLTEKKYVGNVVVQGGCNIQIDSPIWITGDFTVQSGARVSLKNTYGNSSGVIVVDGKTKLEGGSTLNGSGSSGSYMMVISTNTSISSPYAIEISGGNSSSILIAPYGGIHLTGGSNLREASAYKIIMDGGAILTYETGVASPFFSSGPSGSFSVIKGTYQSK